jgi:hypothetical protein
MSRVNTLFITPTMTSERTASQGFGSFSARKASGSLTSFVP